MTELSKYGVPFVMTFLPMTGGFLGGYKFQGKGSDTMEVWYKWVQPVSITLLPHVGGFAGSLISNPQIKGWYKSLNKPWWTPPNWVFPPMWASLYTCMGAASYLVYRDGGGFNGEASTALALYGAQLACNWSWTPVFFGAKKMGLAALILATNWGLVAGCIFTFNPINKVASCLMIPYLAWLTLAGSVNVYTWWYNRPAGKEE